jgi:hypothetical protein
MADNYPYPEEFATEGRMLWRVKPDGSVWYRGDQRWIPESNKITQGVARYAAEMQARANEYHDTTMQQAKRIAELEALRDSLVGIALDVAALTMLKEIVEDGRAEEVDDLIRRARETLDDFVIVPTGSL